MDASSLAYLAGDLTVLDEAETAEMGVAGGEGVANRKGQSSRRKPPKATRAGLSSANEHAGESDDISTSSSSGGELSDDSDIEEVRVCEM